MFIWGSVAPLAIGSVDWRRLRRWPAACRYGIQDSIVTAKQIVARVRLLDVVSTLLLASALGGPACARQAVLGSIGDGPASVLWRGTFEPGDLSEWTGDGEGSVYTQNAAKPTATLAMKHNGRYAGLFTIAPTASMTSTGYLFRNQPSPSQGYYSAWFYVPSTIAVGAWLSLTHFSGSETGDGKNLAAIWDVNLYPLPSGSLAAQLFDYLSGVNTRQTVPVLFPFDTWTRLEVYLSKATGPTGEVTVWQDGVQILQKSNLQTVTTDWVQWDVGGAADATTLPSPAFVYMDDAAISLIPLGTGL
jgi:hypothetical protein